MQNKQFSRSSGLTRLIVKESIRSFLKNNNFEMSAALATYTFFSLIPLLFLVSHMIGSYAILSHTVTSGIENLIGHLFPLAGGLNLRKFLFMTEHKTTWSILALAFVFISIMSLTDTLKTSFQKIFNINDETSFLQTQGRNALSAAAMIVLFFFLLIGEMAYSAFCDQFIRESLYLPVFHVFISLFVTLFCMMIFYRTFLPVRFSLRRLVIVSLISAICIISVRDLFAAYLRANPGYGEAFGSLRVIFIMIIWVYYGFLVTLLGAEIMVNFRKRDALLLKGIFLDEPRNMHISRDLIGKFIRGYRQGEVVFQEGEKGNSMFYVLSGTVNILKKGRIIRVMKKGDYFGEMTMLIDTARTATAAVAEPDTQMVVISRDNFDVILRENPRIVFAILKEMTQRLKLTG
jgi:YihY family inner membrane protein